MFVEVDLYLLIFFIVFMVCVVLWSLLRADSIRADYDDLKVEYSFLDTKYNHAVSRAENYKAKYMALRKRMK